MRVRTADAQQKSCDSTSVELLVCDSLLIQSFVRTCQVAIGPSDNVDSDRRNKEKLYRALLDLPIPRLFVTEYLLSDLALTVVDRLVTQLSEAEQIEVGLKFHHIALTNWRTVVAERANYLDIKLATPTNSFPAAIDPRIRQALMILNTSDGTPHRLSTVAREIGVSASHLSRALRRSTGKGFVELSREAKVIATERMLATLPRLSVKEIAAKLDIAERPL